MHAEAILAARALDGWGEVGEQPRHDGLAHLGQAWRRGRPWMPGPRFFPPPQAVPNKAQVLQVSVSDAGHQRVAVQPGPGAALEVAQPQLTLELLVRLLAHPSGFDCGGQATQRCAGMEVAEGVFALARCMPFAHKPHIGAIHLPVLGMPTIHSSPRASRPWQYAALVS